MKIQNSFRVGLLGGLGVIVAIAIGATIGSLATIITYVGAALFLALGLDPLVSWLEKHKMPCATPRAGRWPTPMTTSSSRRRPRCSAARWTCPSARTPRRT